MFHKCEIPSALNSVKVLLKEIIIKFRKISQFCVLISQLHFHEKQASSVKFWYFLLLGDKRSLQPQALTIRLSLSSWSFCWYSAKPCCSVWMLRHWL